MWFGPARGQQLLKYSIVIFARTSAMIWFPRRHSTTCICLFSLPPLGMRKLAIPATNAAAGSLSSGSVRLAYDVLLAQRPVSGAAYCPSAEPLLLVAYGAVGAQLGAAALLQDHTINTKGVMAVWDLSAPTKPTAVLVSEGSPSCCAWAPPVASTAAGGSVRLVFAGMEEGGVCAWDLDEPDSRHVVVGGQHNRSI